MKERPGGEKQPCWGEIAPKVSLASSHDLYVMVSE